MEMEEITPADEIDRDAKRRRSRVTCCKCGKVAPMMTNEPIAGAGLALVDWYLLCIECRAVAHEVIKAALDAWMRGGNPGKMREMLDTAAAAG